MTMQGYFGDDSRDGIPNEFAKPAREPAAARPIDEIAVALKVVQRLADELPPSAHTSRLSVAIEGAQAAASAHPARKVKR